MREQLEQFLAIQPQFAALRRESEATNAQLRELGESLGRLRAVHDDALHAQKHAASRLEGVEQRSQAAVTKVEAVERRAATAQEALDALLRIAGGIPDAQHQLGVLKAIAEQVAQKTAVLEQQREAVDRAASQTTEVLSLRPQVESALRRQEEQAQAVTALESKLA
jgi:chromosome segregation ATPase